MENKKPSLQEVVEKLEKLFEIFNQKFYNGELQTPVITVSPDVMMGSYGWCTIGKVWKQNGADGEFYEINLCAEYLSRPLKEICATLLHEMVHLWNLQIGVKDTSRGVSYHNKKFKNEAEQRGLLIEHDDKYGWTKTSLQEETAEFIESLAEDAVSLYRTGAFAFHTGKGKSTKKSSSRKYICENCGMSVRATKEVHIKCEDCDCTMIVEE